MQLTARSVSTIHWAHHNHVDGKTAAQFLLSCIRQHVLSPRGLQKLENRIRNLAVSECQSNELENHLANQRKELGDVESQRDSVSQNLARAQTEEQYQAIAKVFDQLCERARLLESKLKAAEDQLSNTTNLDSTIAAAMEIIPRMTDLASGSEGFATPRQVFDLLDARLFLRFRQARTKKRTLNKIHSGVVTLGNASPPIEVYSGPTSRKKIKDLAASNATKPSTLLLPTPSENNNVSGREGNSFRNVSRDDWI